MKTKEVITVPYVFCLRIHPDLKDEIDKASEAENLPMNEYIARVLAEHLGKPELAIIPRKRLGGHRSKKEGA